MVASHTRHFKVWMSTLSAVSILALLDFEDVFFFDDDDDGDFAALPAGDFLVVSSADSAGHKLIKVNRTRQVQTKVAVVAFFIASKVDLEEASTTQSQPPIKLSDVQALAELNQTLC